MICQEVMELMQRYIDGDLDQQETSLMMDHAGQCPDCAAMLVRLQKLSSELEQLPRVVPKFSLVDAILPELERLHAADSAGGSRGSEEQSDAMHGSSRSNRPSRYLYRKISGVVAAGVIVGLLLFGNPSQWSLTGGSSNKDASALDTQSAPAASEQRAMKFNAMMDSNAETPESSQAPVPSSKLSDQISEQTTDNSADKSMKFTGPISRSSADSQNEAVVPKVDNKQQVTATSGGQESGKSSAENPEAISPSEPPMSLNAIPAAVSLSTDGKWRAIAVEGAGTYQVYNTADESELFHSEVREGKISFLNWNEENTILYFTLTDADGHQTQWQFDTVNVKETTR
ncbi:anti-sigma factor family protein [Cohnella silvisoli]|uniref:Anti-sigma-W factor RsiW n=1 Tax=Cohnella silvisoli TaxID=2873699 RepID=A0ABV1KWF2_9BACL|nr:zf-HC2 domain-containing protein [Cohnella silvisoli]MCD9023031.1 zf-HC2 domain-containing protein [Cohnella silvisoli]